MNKRLMGFVKRKDLTKSRTMMDAGIIASGIGMLLIILANIKRDHSELWISGKDQETQDIIDKTYDVISEQVK